MAKDKIKDVEAIRTTTMFLVDAQIEERFEKQIRQEIAAYKKSMLGISTKEGLVAYIKSDRNSIKRLITVLGISGERFKRVVTMIRVQKGYTFTTEWSEETLQRELSQNASLMSEFCDLFLEGKKNPKFKELVPKFILDDFCIDENVIRRICTDDILRQLIKTSMNAAYNRAYGDAYAVVLKTKLRAITDKYGLRLEEKPLSGISGNNLLLVTNTSRYIIINYQFNLTTSNGQTQYAENVVGQIRSNCRNNPDLLVVNVLDGAGWVARSADYKKVYNNCDYFFNLNTIERLEPVIKNFFNIG